MTRIISTFRMMLAALVISVSFSSAVRAESPMEQLMFSDIPNVISSTLDEIKATVAPSTIFSVSGDEIRRWGIRRVSELIDRLIPGAAATEDGDDIIMAFRGVASDTNLKTMLLVNGHYATMQWNNGPQSEIELGFLNDIKAVEVITGPGSALYGSGATIGVINVITESGRDEASQGAKVMARGGSGSFKQIDSSIGGKSNDTSYYYSWGALTSKGLEVVNNNGLNNKPLNVDRFPRNYRFYGDVVHKDFELMARWTSSSRVFYDANVTPTSLNLWTNYDAAFVDARQTLRMGDDAKVVLNLNYDAAQVQRHEFTTGYKYRGVGENRYGGKATFFYTGMDKHNITMGAEYRRDQFGNDWDGANFSNNSAATTVTGLTNIYSRRTITPYGRDVVGVFGQDVIKLTPRLTWLLGVRYDYVENLFPGSQDSAVTPRTALVLQATDKSVVKLMYSSGFHQAQGTFASPDGFGFGGVFRGVVDKPEKMSSFELAGSHRFNERSDVALNLFHNTLENPHGIVAVGTSSGTTTSQGKIEFQGFELIASLRPLSKVFSRIVHQYVTLGSKVDDPINAFTTPDHEHVATAPEQVTKLLVEYRPTPKLSLNANVNHAWKTYTLTTFENNVVTIPGKILGAQTTVNANVALNVTDGIQVVLSGYNVTDVRSKVATSNTGILATKNRAPANYAATVYCKF
jgi:outer membrane receptor protein involved in Fe transport